MTLDGGADVPPDDTVYSIALIEFLQDGGDGYTPFQDGHGAVREPLAYSLLDAIEAAGSVTPTLSGRIEARAP